MKPSKLISLLVCWLGVFLTTNSDLASDREALLALRTVVRSRTIRWNVTETNPCSWLGVKCESRVTELRLPGLALVEQLPLGLRNLTQLLSLSLRVNALFGPLPNDLVNLVNLQNLYLQGLSSGWKGFAVAYDLVDGDALVFQMIRPTTFKVIAKAAQNP